MLLDQDYVYAIKNLCFFDDALDNFCQNHRARPNRKTPRKTYYLHQASAKKDKSP